ncbi:MAG: hypothetical protein QOJ31_1248 [Gaiellales bacterium]|nr:hypothetical protein [Gaiellales bacterium]
MCDSAGVEAAVDHGAVWARALELKDALLTRDRKGVEGLCDPAFWQRAGREELLGLVPHIASATALGVLGRRSLIRLTTPGMRQPEPVLEQLWAHVGGALLVEDERLFALADRAQVESSSDPERLARLRTKLECQDAARLYAAALVAHDVTTATAMWSDAYAAGHGDEVRPQLLTVRRAELIGSVGPRTLVWLMMDDGEHTVELLWREYGHRWLIEGARTFTPGAP